MSNVDFRAAQSGGGLGQWPASLKGRAFNNKTIEIASRIQSLQSTVSPGSLHAGSVARKDTGSVGEKIFDALVDAKVLTSRVAMHLDVELRRKLFRQLDALHDPSEWEAGDRPVQSSSFGNFLKAMVEIHPERRPSLGLTHSGHLVAAWTRGKDHLAIEFLPCDRVRWILSRNDGLATSRFAGDVSVDHLANALAPYNPEYWLVNVKENKNSE